MNANEIIQETIPFIEAVSPFLFIFFVLATADRLIDLVYKAVQGLRNRSWS
jgi:hypothetical protein